MIYRNYVSSYDWLFDGANTKTLAISRLRILGLYSLSGRTSSRKISRSLKVAKFIFRHFQSFWHLTGTLAAALPKCLSNFRAIRSLKHLISRLPDFTKSYGKTSIRLVNRGTETGGVKIHTPFKNKVHQWFIVELKSTSHFFQNNVKVIQPKRRTTVYGLWRIAYTGAKLWNDLSPLFFIIILKQNQQYIHANCKHTYTNSINDMI